MVKVERPTHGRVTATEIGRIAVEVLRLHVGLVAVRAVVHRGVRYEMHGQTLAKLICLWCVYKAKEVFKVQNSDN